MQHPSLAASRFGAIAAALLCLSLTACVTVKLPPATASADNVQKLRAAPLAPAAAGTFALAAGKPADMDTRVGGLRGSSLEPSNGSFARHLRDTLVAELVAAGLHDEKSAIRIDAELTESALDAAIGTGTGSLGARFTVTRAGKQVYSKTLRVQQSWESSFVGAVALPEAINRYGSFHKLLIGQLFDDAEFRAALAK